MGMNKTLRMEFPIPCSMAKLLGSIECRRDDYSVHHNDDFRVLPDTRQCKPKQVIACHNHVAFVSEDESIWGMGYRV